MRFPKAARTALLATATTMATFSSGTVGFVAPRYIYAHAASAAAASASSGRRYFSTASAATATTIAMMLPRGGGAATTTARSATTTTINSDDATVTSTTETDESETTSCASSSSSSSSSAMDAYQELVTLLEDITHLSRASAVLSYDQMVFMPQTDAASTERGKQMAALAAVLHEKSIHPRIGVLLDQLSLSLDTTTTSEELTSEQERVVELARKAYRKKTKVPTNLASQQAALQSQAYNTWAKARAADDYDQFVDMFRDSIEIAKEITAKIQTDEEIAAGKPLYATMLDDYEVGMDPSRMDAIFDTIQAALVPLIDTVLGPTATPPNTAPLQGEFDIASQEALSKEIVRAIGFDDSQGRIDVSVHPFSSSMSKHDVRITSRFSTTEWYQGLAGSMHEAGHAMYEQNMGGNATSTTTTSALQIDSALSMGMHESQSLFWERHVGLSKPFWNYATPIVNQHLKNMTYTSDDYYAAVNAAQRSLIRVEADELTYPLHVILRYQIERDFVQGTLDVKDIPARWNEGMKSLLHITVPSNAKGCLQDVHWSMGAYGYFPTYLLGAATAAQLAHYCQLDIPDFEQKVAAGDFQEIRAWMTDKVHRHGSRYKSLDEHLEAQVGEALNPQYFIEYLTKKYTELYQCK